MNVFKEYATYYDLLYQDKDYAAETTYIHDLIQRHAPSAQSILNLGCGSGRHDRCLAEHGYTVTGVDLSTEMLSAAKTAALNNSALGYVHGDIQNIQLNRTYDVVISIFHVMSYQVTNQELTKAFATVRKHLKPGGLFIFDFWYGAGVLSDLPKIAIKRLQNESIKITRLAEPCMHSDRNVVDVHYTVFALDKSSATISETEEIHSMRYFFRPELELYLSRAKLTPICFYKWMTMDKPDVACWFGVMVAKAETS